MDMFREWIHQLPSGTIKALCIFNMHFPYLNFQVKVCEAADSLIFTVILIAICNQTFSLLWYLVAKFSNYTLYYILKALSKQLSMPFWRYRDERENWIRTEKNEPWNSCFIFVNK